MPPGAPVLKTGTCVAKLGLGFSPVLSGLKTLSRTCITPFASNKSEVMILAELIKKEFEEKDMVMGAPFSVSRDRVVPFWGKEVE